MNYKRGNRSGGAWASARQVCEKWAAAKEKKCCGGGARTENQAAENHL